MPIPRLPKDFASTLMTVACADALLMSDGCASAHAWEAGEYGLIKRGYGFGSKTRGSLARNLSGKVVVSHSRLEEWKAGRPAVAALAACPLWLQLRHPRQLTTDELIAQEPTTRMTMHINNFFAPNRRAKVTEELIGQLATCGTLDAVAALWSLLLEAKAEDSHEIAWQCARHMPPALALAAQNRPVRRVALPIFARIRQLALDALNFNGQKLQLSRYELLRVSESAVDLPPLQITGSFRSSPPVIVGYRTSANRTVGRELVVPEARLSWVLKHLIPEVPARMAACCRVGMKWLSRDGKPGIRPCDPQATHGLHPLAIARLREALGDWH